MFFSEKVYDYNSGLSCAFRQWRAQSHCRFIHGYAIRVRLVFAAKELDRTNWVVDFGSLKPFKQILEDTLDHKLLVATDDPHYAWFEEGQRLGTLEMIPVDATGCEAMAKLIFDVADIWLGDAGYKPRVNMHFVQVSEHSGNFAGYSNIAEHDSNAAYVEAK